MKRYIIVNRNKAVIREFKSESEARNWAHKKCDPGSQVFVSQLDEILDTTIEFDYKGINLN